MVEDTEAFHGLPTMGTLKSPGQYSPTGNGHPKQPQQHFPPCTTQASPPAMTDDRAGALSGCRTPSMPSSPQRLETFVPAELPRRSQSPVLEPNTAQHGAADAGQQEPMLADPAQNQEYSSEDLQHRIKNMWPSRPSESQDCDEFDMIQRRVSDTVAGPSSSQPAHLSQGSDGYEPIASPTRGWMANSQNMFQQPFSWNALAPSTQPSFNPSIYYQNGLDLFVDEGHLHNNSAPYNPGMGHLRRSFDEADPNYLNFNPSTSPFPVYTTSTENVPSTSLSPSASLPFYEAPTAMCQDREDTVPLSEGDIDPEYKDGGWWPDELLGGSPSSIEAPGSKVDEPYAQLIYRAFISRPTKSMTLQEIYSWFRENTDKAKAEGKGWQNSIRHNLSMNGAFTKRNSKTPLNGNTDGSVSLDNTGVDGRKSTEWFLEPNFYAGVESTTRYRKGNSGSRLRTANGHPGRSRLGSDGHSGGVFSHARVSAGRKGGNVAAQNRKRLAERQQHARQIDVARGHPRHLHVPGFHGAGAMSYPVGAFDGASEVYNYHHPAYNPAAPPHSTFPPPMPAFGGVPAARQTDMIGYNNFFGSDDVGRDVHIKRSRTLGTENEHSEPTTPPGAGLDPPRSTDNSFGGGGGGGGGSSSSSSKHREFLPDMGGSYNPLNSYQHALGAMGGTGGHEQPQQQSYSLADVVGIYEPPAGSHQPPVFMEQDLNLGSEDTLLMDLNLIG